VNARKEIKQMRSFDRCSISSSFPDNDNVNMNGHEFAFPASFRSLNALLENREMLGISHGDAPGSGGLLFTKQISLKWGTPQSRKCFMKIIFVRITAGSLV
jgi:hypothetical protein